MYHNIRPFLQKSVVKTNASNARKVAKRAVVYVPTYLEHEDLDGRNVMCPLPLAF